MKIETPRTSRRLGFNGPARYKAPSDEHWTDCRVLDLSMGGAAIEIPIPDVEPSGRVLLDLQRVDGHLIELQLRAEVSYWEPSEDSCVRLGLAFVDLTNLDRYRLAGLMSRKRRAAAAEGEVAG